MCFLVPFQQLSNILKDPEATSNDKFVALELLKNANIAAGMILPGCQDTGTAIVMGLYALYTAMKKFCRKNKLPDSTKTTPLVF